MRQERLEIISYSDASFADRQEAAKLLAEHLHGLGGKDTVVLGIPRGGLIIARQVSKVIGAEFDLVLARKIPAPGQAELAIGSVGEDGKLLLNEDLAQSVGADKFYIEKEKQKQVNEIKKRIQIFRQAKEKIPLAQKRVIITDDGVATGSTMQAAIWAVRQEEPKKIIVAVPVGAKDSLELLAMQADLVIALRVPQYLGAVGAFYDRFEQVLDSQVIDILKGTKAHGK